MLPNPRRAADFRVEARRPRRQGPWGNPTNLPSAHILIYSKSVQNCKRGCPHFVHALSAVCPQIFPGGKTSPIFAPKTAPAPAAAPPPLPVAGVESCGPVPEPSRRCLTMTSRNRTRALLALVAVVSTGGATVAQT